MRPALAHLISALLAATAAQADCDAGTGAPVPIDASRLYIENNAGDGDIGVHGDFDHDGWRELCVFAPDGAMILHALPGTALGALGLSNLFFESVEPDYADLGYAELAAAFPEGEYTVGGVTLDGRPLTGAARFTTIVPAMPEILAPPTVAEADDPAMPVLPLADLEVRWASVTTSLDGRPITITGYQLTVVRDDASDPNGFARADFSIHLGPEATSQEVPASLFAPGGVYEIEVLAIEESGNQTIGGASFFAIEPAG